MRTLILLIMLVCAFPTISFAQTTTKQVYIALGDSLAAGQTPYREIDTGYTDLIALRLQQKGQLQFYTKQLAFPGYTVDDVLERVQSEEATQYLSSATLITISAGANDLLRLVQANMNAGTLSYSQLATDFALNHARKSVKQLLSELKERAPKAQIYVMGYYFAYPFAHDTQKQGTVSQLETLNAVLKQEAALAEAEYVSVFEHFGLEAKSLVPNPSDVHPNMEGYRMIANAFLAQYFGSEAYALSATELPKPNPLSFEQLLDMRLTDSEQQSKQQAFVKKTPLSKYVVYVGYDRQLV